jgi:hypothetical protein
VASDGHYAAEVCVLACVCVCTRVLYIVAVIIYTAEGGWVTANSRGCEAQKLRSRRRRHCHSSP